MIKPNVDEIEMLIGKKVVDKNEIIKAAQEVRRQGVVVVVVSMGADGALVSSSEGDFEVRVPRINAVNTVGCGDSMTAGFAVGLARALPLTECMRLAGAISAASAMRLETGYFCKEDMEALLPQIRISEL